MLQFTNIHWATYHDRDWGYKDKYQTMPILEEFTVQRGKYDKK